MDAKQFQEDTNLYISALNDGCAEACKEAYDTRDAHYDLYTPEQKAKVDYLWKVI